ncbi:hypothetical protein HZC30_06270 [Candidatus Woesearchaeota archaeon]|nr:hypothetical protein [Candidatus Woesearchaeota archaeon]
MKKEVESFSTIGHLIRAYSKNIIGEVVDEVYFFDGRSRHSLQKIQSEIDKNSYFYIFQVHDMKKEHISPVIPPIFPEHILSELLKKAKERKWGI